MILSNIFIIIINKFNNKYNFKNKNINIIYLYKQ